VLVGILIRYEAIFFMFIIIRIFFDSTLQNLVRLVSKKKGKGQKYQVNNGQTSYFNSTPFKYSFFMMI